MIADQLMEIFRGAYRRAEKRNSEPVRPARHRHRIPGGADRAADQADRGPDRAPQGAQARPPLAAGTAASGGSPAAADQVRVPSRCRALPLAHRAARPASLTPGKSRVLLAGYVRACRVKPFWAYWARANGAVCAD